MTGLLQCLSTAKKNFKVEDSMVIKCLPIGLFASNCYIVGQNGEGVVIDPGCSPQMIVDAAKETIWKLNI